MPRKPRIISLFSGAGGLDHGFEAAGFKTAVAVEMDPHCCATLRTNRKGMQVIERTIFDVPSEELLEKADLEPGDLDLVIGGPPCQPFSKSGYWANGDTLRLDDPRASTLAAYFRVVEDTLPRCFLLENVEGLAYNGKSEAVRWMLQRIDEINRRAGTSYAASYKVLRAADYGVPQLRERFFLVAARDGSRFGFPSPTHRESGPGDQASLLDASMPPYRTAWDALADVEPDRDEVLEPRGKWAGLLPSVPEGENYLWHTARGGGLPLFGWRRRYWSFLLKLAKNRPSWTIQAQPGPATGPFHWENRRLSHRELCRLQTFPDDIRISGSRNAIQRQVGNAVPSLLAEVLGREIRSQVLGLRVSSKPLSLLPPDRSPCPPPERTRRVPPSYRELVGDHSEHPGPGKGHRAQSWQTSP